jgi:hypothetical protein
VVFLWFVLIFSNTTHLDSLNLPRNRWLVTFELLAGKKTVEFLYGSLLIRVRFILVFVDPFLWVLLHDVLRRFEFMLTLFFLVSISLFWHPICRSFYTSPFLFFFVELKLR